MTEESCPSQADDAPDFAEFYELFGRRICSLTRYIVFHSRIIPSDEWEDIAQIVLDKVYRKLGTLDEPQKIWAWAKRIIRNTIKDANKYVQARVLPHNVISTTDTVKMRAVFLPKKDSIEDRILIKELFEMLNPDRRKIFYLHYIERLDISEIAEELGVKENSIHQTLCRGRQEIKKALKLAA